MKNSVYRFTTNFGLLISGFVMGFSGLLMQIQFHIGDQSSASLSRLVLGISYPSWSLVHKIAILVFSIFVFYHVYRNHKWYKTVIQKKRIDKNKPLISLSILLILSAVSGFIPWCIYCFNEETAIRKTIIEIHDKISIILLIYIILHIIKKRSYFYRLINPLQHKHNIKS